MNYLLIGIVVFFILMVANGYRIGLIRSVFFCGTSVLALVFASQCYQFVGKGIDQYTNLSKTIETSIEKNLELKPTKNKKVKRTEQTKKIQEMKLPQSIKDSLIENNNTEIYDALKVSGFYEYIAGYLSKTVINGIAYIITFLVGCIIIRLLLRILDFITEIPILHGLNCAGGMILGAIEALIGIWLFFLVITIMGSTEFGQTMYGYINDNVVLSILYNNNYLLVLLTNMSKLLF